MASRALDPKKILVNCNQTVTRIGAAWLRCRGSGSGNGSWIRREGTGVKPNHRLMIVWADKCGSWVACGIQDLYAERLSALDGLRKNPRTASHVFRIDVTINAVCSCWFPDLPKDHDAC